MVATSSQAAEDKQRSSQSTSSRKSSKGAAQAPHNGTTVHQRGGINAEAARSRHDEYSAVLSSLILSSLLMGCSSLLYAGSALVRTSGTLPATWSTLWTSLWTPPDAAIRDGRQNGVASSGSAAMHRERHNLWQAGHALLSNKGVLIDSRIALLLLLTLVGFLCTLLVQQSLVARRRLASTLFQGTDQAFQTEDGDKNRYEPPRGRSKFSLRSGTDSPRASRPSSRAQSPSSSAASSQGSRQPAPRVDNRPSSRKTSNKGKNKAVKAVLDDQYASLPFADQIFIKFRTPARTSTYSAGDAATTPRKPTILRESSDQGRAQPNHASNKSASTPSTPTATASQDKVFSKDQLLNPHADDERALRKVYDDLVVARAAVSELTEQLNAHSEQSTAARAALEATLETLRARRKTEDTERAALRARVKALDEERRVAESKRREAERKLDGSKSKLSALEREWTESERAQASAKDTRSSLRDAWTRREAEAKKRTEELAVEISKLLEAAQRDEGTRRGAVGNAGGVKTSQASVSDSSPTSSVPSPTTDSPQRDQVLSLQNAKAVRDRIKTLEGQIKKERERLEKIKRSASASNAGPTVATSSPVAPSAQPANSSQAPSHGHASSGRGSHGSSTKHGSPAPIHRPIQPPQSASSGTTMAPAAQPTFSPIIAHPHTALPSPTTASGQLASNGFNLQPNLRPLDGIEFHRRSPVREHRDLDGRMAFGHQDGLLPLHMHYPTHTNGPTSEQSAAMVPASVLGDSNVERLPAWVRSSVFGSSFGGAAPGRDGDALHHHHPHHQHHHMTSMGGTEGLASAIHQPNGNGTALLSGSPLAPHRNLAQATAQLPWDWPSFGNHAGGLPRFMTGTEGDALLSHRGGGSSTTTPTTLDMLGSSLSSRLNGGSTFASDDLSPVLPLHQRTNLANLALSTSVSAAAFGAKSASSGSPQVGGAQNLLPLPVSVPISASASASVSRTAGAGAGAGVGHARHLLPASLAVTPIKTSSLPQRGASAVSGLRESASVGTGTGRTTEGSITMDVFAPASSSSSSSSPASPSITTSLKARPRTSATRRRARTPVSPYSAGLLPRSLLSYVDDEEEEMSAHEMESAWASLEEEVEDEFEDGDEGEEGDEGDGFERGSAQVGDEEQGQAAASRA